MKEEQLIKNEEINKERKKRNDGKRFETRSKKEAKNGITKKLKKTAGSEK